MKAVGQQALESQSPGYYRQERDQTVWCGLTVPSTGRLNGCRRGRVILAPSCVLQEISTRNWMPMVRLEHTLGEQQSKPH
jgi:hypothetical protein